MTATTSADNRTLRVDKTRRLVAHRRRGLLLPILMLVILTLVAMVAVLYWSADALNRRQAETEVMLVTSTLEARRAAFRTLVIDYAWWDEVIYVLDQELDERWASEELGAYLLEAFGIRCLWVVGPDNETKIAFVDGRPTDVPIFDRLPPNVSTLLDAARQGRTIDAVPEAGFISLNGQLEVIAASIVAPFEQVGDPPAPEDASVVVFTRPLANDFFAASSLGSLLEMPKFVDSPPDPGLAGHQVMGLDGVPVGHVVWQERRPGDDLLWRGAPLLILALLILLVLMVLTIRRVDALVVHEGRLALSLDHERQRREDKSRFVSMVSHEFRTPLQAIRSAADMLERRGEKLSQAEWREETETIREGVSALSNLVDDVLLVGRVDAPGKTREGEAVNLADLCSAVWREASLALRARQTLKLSDRIALPAEGCQPVMLHTILSNLFQNAIKYSQGAPSVEVELSLVEDSYQISVRDFGPGIPKEMREAVFEPYWRGASTVAVQGAGLGMSVARSAARSMNGDITIEDDDLQVGTRFVLRWPTPAKVLRVVSPPIGD
ncbi:ATP-binding protein [Pelagibius sp.]|uniref:sensor histidine kinase n=1 Tax=Pelagibius sp. TaxID=1931238 RepID=UPI00261962CD|nr:ATP-binding protein [Pelagibius sp.]